MFSNHNANDIDSVGSDSVACNCSIMIIILDLTCFATEPMAIVALHPSSVVILFHAVVP